MQIILSTYPRSGSQLLNDYIRQCTNIIPIKTHDPASSDTDLKVVSIARNPFDSIASLVSMEDSFYGFDLNAHILQKIDQYIYFYSNMDKVDLLFSYDELVADTGVAVDKIAELVNATKNGREYVSSLKDYEIVDGQRVSGYVISSKKLEKYDQIAQRLKSYDLSLCNDLYNRSLDRATRL